MNAHAPPAAVLRPARIVALALIALVALGLGYVRLKPDDRTVSVPAGAHAGELTLEPCHYATEKGAYRADCGTLVVPENRADPHSRLIALPVTRIRARSRHPREPVFRLQGGPGVTNMQFSKASRIAGDHDVVLVGYRGVDGSSKLECPEVVSALRHSADLLSRASARAKLTAFRSCAARLRSHGVDLAGYSLPQRVDDLEAARVALRYHRIDLVSESAGTRTAMIYAWRHPRSLHRSVMIGVNPPGNFVWRARTTDAQLRRYSRLCAADDACGGRTVDLAASMRRTAARMPDRWGPLPIGSGNARLASFFGLMESTSAASPLSAPMTIDSWLSAAKGDPSGLWLLSLMARLSFPRAEVWGDVAAVSRADARAAERYFHAPASRGSILGDPGTEFLWGRGGLVHAWPSTPDENDYDRVRDSDVPTLLVDGNLDFATPARNATRELLPHLPNGRQVVLSDLGHTTDFWSYQPRASTRLLTSFLDRGTVDHSLYRHRAVDFRPAARHATLAKFMAAIMASFVLVASVSLLWMARRRRFGPRTRVALRSVHPLVLGLGGWFLGLVVVMNVAPSVALDDGLLAAVSVGVPIGLGIFWASVDREAPARATTAGFAAAMVGALGGAWLGFSATAGLAALVTAIAGATAGANLILIVLDMARERRVRPAKSPAPRTSPRPMAHVGAD
jgi:pimeloyl-ACP methyl ester carboxylesterase